MNLDMLLIDEIKGYYRSKVMAVLWVGLPVITIIMHSIQPETQGISFLYISGLLVASVGGLIGCVTLATSISTELDNHVYDLFLIRPVRRTNLLLAKFIAVIVCVIIAVCFSFLVGYVLDFALVGAPSEVTVQDSLNSLSTNIAAIFLACSLGVLIGVANKSVAVSAIIGIYAGGQLSGVIALAPILLPSEMNPHLFVIALSTIIAPIILIIGLFLFERKQF
jgi:ABC-2 type transport system permease protein